MSRYRTFDDARIEGRIESQADAVLTVLNGRWIAVSESIRKRILAQTDLRQLQRWLERAIVATSIREVIRPRARVRSAKTNKAVSSRKRPTRRRQRAAASR